MNVASACPSTEELQEYLLGRAAGLTADDGTTLGGLPGVPKALAVGPGGGRFCRPAFAAKRAGRSRPARHLDNLVERLRSLVLTLPIAQDATTPALGEPTSGCGPGIVAVGNHSGT